MKLLVALLGLCLAGAASAEAAVTPTAQPLSISVYGDGAQATRLPVYDPSLPIAVAVTNRNTQRVDALTVAAVGPTGAEATVPLARDSDGAYRGSLTLAEPGTWRLRLVSRIGSLRTDTTPVFLNVQAPPPSNAGLIGWAVGAGVFVLVGGAGFFILRRILSTPAGRELEQAA